MDDIRPILDAWPYDPGSNVRKIVGIDGREKLQIRLPLGIQQFELDGRPDGARPEGKESLLDVYMDRATASEQAGEEFNLSSEDCASLAAESVSYYQRYVVLFQMGDYKRTARDTEHNIRLFGFVQQYGTEEEDITSLIQYWPYLIRMNRMALIMDALNEERHDKAAELVREAIELIEELAPVDTPTFVYEKQRSLELLYELKDELAKRHPPSERERLRKELEEAIRLEDYERAAKLRDRLKEL